MNLRPPGGIAALTRVVWLTLAAVVVAVPISGQSVSRPDEGALEPEDSTDVLGRARRAQGRFERLRVNHFPLVFAGGGGSCDETVGRFCTWYDEGDWAPEPEATEIVTLRQELIAYLDSVQGLLPGDGWVLGQRVWYAYQSDR